MSVFGDDTTKLRLTGAPTPQGDAKSWGSLQDTAPPPFRLPANPPHFDDATQPPVLFLALYQDWAEFNGVPLKDWLLCLGQCVSGSAKAWFRSTVREWVDAAEEITCAVFRDAFLQRFLGDDWQSQVRQALDSFSYANVKSIHSFVSVFGQLDSFIEHRSPEDRLFLFMSKLPDECARFVRHAQPTDLSKAMSHALRFDRPRQLTYKDLLGVTHSAPACDPHHDFGGANPGHVPMPPRAPQSPNPPPRAPTHAPGSPMQMDFDTMVLAFTKAMNVHEKERKQRSKTAMKPRVPHSSGQVCRIFRDTGSCQYGESCIHLHVSK